MKNADALTAMNPRLYALADNCQHIARLFARLVAASVALCVPYTAHAAQVRPADTAHYTFAVVSGAITKPADESAAQRLIEAASRTSRLSFVVYDGNLKGMHEACTDALYDRRHAILAASRAPLIFVPGQRDWINCASPPSASVDPLERLDQLRNTFFPDSSSMGLRPVMLTRESETSRFQPYRENTRWQVGNTVFVTLNMPGGNNHYLDAGGRNGEFEDRAIANAFWLERAGEYAKQHNAHTLVIFVEASPFGKFAQRAERFAWLRRIGRQPPPDGYAGFRRSLVKLAQAFHGPIVLIHASDEPLAHGFLIDLPLRNERGVRVPNVTRVAFGLHAPRSQWLYVDANTARRPFLRVSVHNVPK
jgi:hypothetical protein